jgi:hypothetical protein
LPALESRLKGRYLRLVMEHLSPAQQLAAGLRSLPGSARPFAAATRAAWRFYANPRVGLPALAGPLIERARSGAAEACDRHVLVVLDWSALHYPAHAGKADRIKLTSYEDFGYNLLTALAISDRDGGPPAPVCLELGARPTARAQHAGGHARGGRFAPGRPGTGHATRRTAGPGPSGGVGHRPGGGFGRALPPADRPAAAAAAGPRRRRARLVLHEGRQRKLGDVAGGLGSLRFARPVRF